MENLPFISLRDVEWIAKLHKIGRIYNQFVDYVKAYDDGTITGGLYDNE